MLSLNFLNSASDKSVFSFSFLFSMPQNYFGRCLSISGRSNCICARPVLQAYTYLFSACWVCGCIFPLFFTAFLYLARAILQFAVNHGARCFSHLFGFRDVCFVVAFRTPTCVASSSRNCSICSARSLLSSSNDYMMALNLASNSGVEVCYFHVTALLLYSFRHVPSIHR
jgi:hypothetical protein